MCSDLQQSVSKLRHFLTAAAQYIDDLIARLFNVGIEQLFAAVDKFSGAITVGLDGERVYGCQDAITSDVTDIVAQLQQGVVRRFLPPEGSGVAGARGQSPPPDRRSPSPVHPPESPTDADVDNAALEAMAM